jgi:acyl carrier protein
MTNTTARVEAAIRAALGTIKPASAGIDGDADLALEAGLDSVEVMDLVMEIEDRLDVSIPVESLAEASTVNQLRAGICLLVDGAAAGAARPLQ